MKWIKSFFIGDKDDSYDISTESIFNSLNGDSTKDEVKKQVGRLYDGKNFKISVVLMIIDIIYEVNLLKHKVDK